MNRTLFALVAFFTSGMLFAQAPVLTSIDPSEGTVAGGTRVILHGQNLNFPCRLAPCQPTTVSFGGYPTVTVTPLGDDTVSVAVPPLPSYVEQRIVDVSLRNSGGYTTLPNSFAYHDERVLVPVIANDTPGALGSIWRTRLTVHNSSQADLDLAPIDHCTSTCPSYIIVYPGGYTHPDWVQEEGGFATGRFFTIVSGDPRSLSMHLVAEDVTRLEKTAGTELPLVRESHFLSGAVRLLGTHASPLFRDRLRIYLDGDPVPVAVRTFSVDPLSDALQLAKEVTIVPARPAVSDSQWYMPSYDIELEQGMLPTPDRDYVVEIEPTSNVPFWAFVSVTNNETAHITTITPQ